MYRVVLIDDERIIVEGLRKVVKWEEYNCGVVGTANNAAAGAALIRQLRPHIVFTDIRMPDQDGLTMLAGLKSEFPEMQICVLTGYRDFNYAQEAIRLGVTRFLLKPSKMDEIDEALDAMTQKLEQLPPESAVKLQESLQKLFSGKEFQELLKNGMTEQWLMTPDEVQDKTKVERLYDRLDSQLSRLAQTLSETAKGSALGKSITTLQNNLEFMNELNHVYSFVQLPLKMSEGTAHGDLYVYTNKKGLASRDGKISALLHLDMEHLGPVDVYVAMEMEKVNTHFYLPDEEMLSFIAQHLYLLDERLEKKGYAMNTVASVKGQEKEAVEEMLASEPPMTKLSPYSFDVRA